MVGRERKGDREGEIWKDRERGREEERVGWRERERWRGGGRNNWREGRGGGTKLDIINKRHNSLYCSFLSTYT